MLHPNVVNYIKSKLKVQDKCVVKKMSFLDCFSIWKPLSARAWVVGPSIFPEASGRWIFSRSDTCGPRCETSTSVNIMFSSWETSIVRQKEKLKVHIERNEMGYMILCLELFSCPLAYLRSLKESKQSLRTRPNELAARSYCKTSACLPAAIKRACRTCWQAHRRWSTGVSKWQQSSTNCTRLTRGILMMTM